MISYIKGAFSDNGSPSSSRIMSAVCTFAVIIWFSYVVFVKHIFPDPLSLTAGAGFGTSHYAANRLTQKSDDEKKQ